MIFRIFAASFLSLVTVSFADDWSFTELRRYPAPEAIQGVAVDKNFFYAIDSRAIGKYRKDTGELVTRWEDEEDGRFRHLNAGVVHEERLYCAHSNYPKMPREASLEVWDTKTLKHVESINIVPNPAGTFTWADRRDGVWYGAFCFYSSRNEDPTQTRLVKFDGEWKVSESWAFPAGILERFAKRSCSGGSFDAQGRLFISGHDERELYLIDTPAANREFLWLASVPVGAPGQAFAWDLSQGAEGIVYGIERKTREVVVSKVAQKTP